MHFCFKLVSTWVQTQMPALLFKVGCLGKFRFSQIISLVMKIFEKKYVAIIV